MTHAETPGGSVGHAAQSRLWDRREVAAWLGDTALTVANTYRNVLVNTLDNISDSLREGVNVRQVGL